MGEFKVRMMGARIFFECPGCEVWYEVDDDQYNGRVSILCKCGFHETINLAKHAEVVD